MPASAPLPTCTCSKYPPVSWPQLTRGHERFWQLRGGLLASAKAQRAPTGSNLKMGFQQVLEKIGSSGRTRTYNPPVNSRTDVLVFSYSQQSPCNQRAKRR